MISNLIGSDEEQRGVSLGASFHLTAWLVIGGKLGVWDKMGFCMPKIDDYVHFDSKFFE